MVVSFLCNHQKIRAARRGSCRAAISIAQNTIRMTAPDITPDPARCPLCGGPNGCGALQPAPADGTRQPCWCAQADIPPALLARIPPQARRRACVCAACVAAEAAAIA
jgi:hypothetical protein